MCFPLIQKFCSAELLGYKFMVPCEVEQVLEINYGDVRKWNKPVVSNFELPHTDWGNGETRNERELPYLFRYYHKNGSIDENKTLNEINNYLSLYNFAQLTKLPTNDDEYL